MSRATTSLALVAALVVATPSGPAQANGKFPQAGQLVVAPDDPSHFALRTTFGVLDSRDAGQRWQWICEAAVGYQDYEPPLALAAEGTLLMALQQGIARSVGGCEWSAAGGDLSGLNVVDLSVSKATPDLAVAFTFDPAQVLTQLWRSTDGGASWSAHGSPLPASFIGYTLDLAPGDPTTIYLSGLVGDPPEGVLLRSTDDGASWETLPIPGSGLTSPPYIGAMDPLDDATLYLRLPTEPGRLLGTFDAGQTWTELFTAQGFTRGLAISPDGSQVLVGGEQDGVWRADVPAKSQAAEPGAWQFEAVSDFSPFCLTWLDDGDVLACGHVFFNDGVAVARSTDAGATFEEVFCFGEIDEVLDCGAGSTLEATCASELANLDDQVPAGTCGSDDTTSTTTGAGGGSGGQGGAPSASPPPSDDSGGCGIHAAAGRAGRKALPWLMIAAVGLFARRRLRLG